MKLRARENRAICAKVKIIIYKMGNKENQGHERPYKSENAAVSYAQRIGGLRYTSEKSIEAYLCKRVKEAGGLCMKYSNPNQTGYPDRVVLMPCGVTHWVELKSKGCKPSKLQTERFRQMEAIGHAVAVLDSKEAVDGFMAVVRRAVFEAGCGMATDAIAADTAITGAGDGTPTSQVKEGGEI